MALTKKLFTLVKPLFDCHITVSYRDGETNMANSILDILA